MAEAKRIDLHVHSFLSDGVLLPSEVLRWVVVKGYRAIAITDHADTSDMEELVTFTTAAPFLHRNSGDCGTGGTGPCLEFTVKGRSP